MTFVCLSSPAWPTDAATSTELVARALEVAPRVRAEPALGILWADARGLDAGAIAGGLLALADLLGLTESHAGIAATPIAADVAARTGPERLTVVPSGTDRAFLAHQDIGVLRPVPPATLYPLLASVGIERCGDLATLDREAVEIRFGHHGTTLWRLARADDPRILFPPRPRDLPSAEVEWVDYELDRQEHLLFIVNSLLGTVADQLVRDRHGAHALALEFRLADRSSVVEPIRAAQPTADRKTWLRVIRARLEQVTFAAPVTRIRLAVERVAPLDDRQGDLFDRGFATARATEAALAHLLDLQPDAIAIPARSSHPLPEQRLTWSADPAGDSVPKRSSVGAIGLVTDPVLTIQTLPAPTAIDVWTITRRDAVLPDRYYDGIRTYTLASSLGPDRISGGFGAERFARDYFQCVRDDGVMVLLAHDQLAERWFLVGWWD
jgi:hypothetical protein